MRACFSCKGCDACFYSDACPEYMGEGYGCAHIQGTLTAVLCSGRHDTPADARESIFPSEISDPTDLALMDEICENSLRGNVEEGDTLRVYVTGLTVALVTVINWCRRNMVKLVLLHYDRNTGSYYEQEVA